MAKALSGFTTLVLFSALTLAVYADDCIQDVYVKTGDVDHAGTDARVTIKLFDKEGYWVGDDDLESKGIMGSGYDYFERNQLDHFAFKTRCLSNPICNLALYQDNTGEYPGWFVEYVKVSTLNPSNGQYTHIDFQINQWLAVDEPPGAIFIVVDLCGVYSGLINITNDNMSQLNLSKSA